MYATAIVFLAHNNKVNLIIYNNIKHVEHMEDKNFCEAADWMIWKNGQKP